MNAWLVLAVVLAVGGAGGGGVIYGIGLGVDRAAARQARDDQVTQQTRDAAEQGAAIAIAKLKPVNKTIVQRAEKEIHENTIYRDCRVPVIGMQLANEAITGAKPEPPGDRKLPGPSTAQ